MPEIPKAAVDAALARRADLLSDRPDPMVLSEETLTRLMLEAAAPILADKIASAILRYADEHEPSTGSGTYLAWHRHFEAASAVAAWAFGRDNLEAPGVRPDPQ